MGFHEGELAVQRRAGVSAEAARLVGMLAPGDLSRGAAGFLAGRDLALLTARDANGRLWIAPLVARPGFLAGDGAKLRIAAKPRPADALAELRAGQSAAVLAIDLVTRRRMRVNGTLSVVGRHELGIDVVEAFGNCPQYIHPHTVRLDDGAAPDGLPLVQDSIDEVSTAIIASADTFFLGTVHPTRGADASHRGGPPGFVRVEGNELSWPDYPGNNMFNSFGNLAVDPSAALVFIDFETGTTVQLSGLARLDWTGDGDDPDGGTGRRVRFTAQRVVRR